MNVKVDNCLVDLGLSSVSRDDKGGSKYLKLLGSYLSVFFFIINILSIYFSGSYQKLERNHKRKRELKPYHVDVNHQIATIRGHR